jgi:hypothetical protein
MSEPLFASLYQRTAGKAGTPFQEGYIDLRLPV